MQVFAYKMCNFSKKVFQCPPEMSDFSFFNSQITNYKSQRAHGVWYGLKEYVRTFQFVQNPIERLVNY